MKVSAIVNSEISTTSDLISYSCRVFVRKEGTNLIGIAIWSDVKNNPAEVYVYWSDESFTKKYSSFQLLLEENPNYSFYEV